MDFSKGYSASFFGTYYNPFQRFESGTFDIISGSINREDSDLRQSASLTLKDYEGLNDQWIRIYMDAKQGSDSERVCLFTGLASCPSQSYQDGVLTTNVQCYSVLKAVSDVMLPIGWYAPAFSNGAKQIQTLLQDLPFPVYVSDEVSTLKSAIVAEDDETKLSMTDAILNSMVSEDENSSKRWKLQIGGDGSIYLSPYSDKPVAIFSYTMDDVIESSFSVDRDWFECPNVFRVIDGDVLAIARDDDENSELSTIARGREIWMSESSAEVADGESVGAYAQRRLLEEQSRSEKYSYPRRYLPYVNQGDLIRIMYPEINGDFYVESQSINLGINAQTNETIYRDV